MRTIEVTGKSVDEAVRSALDTLGIKKGNAEIQVLSEPSQGIFSFMGNKNAHVAVSVCQEPAPYMEHFLRKLLELMSIEADLEVTEENDQLKAVINGKNVGILIGRRGKTLNELQYLMNTVMRRQFNDYKKLIIIDAASYRSRREETLTQLAKSVAKKVGQGGVRQTLEPMTPQERRIIHLALQEYPEIETYSEGEDPYRRVVIAPRQQ